MQGLQHQAVAAQRHDGVGLGEVGVAVMLGELAERVGGLLGLAGNEGDFLEAGHGSIEAL